MFRFKFTQYLYGKPAIERTIIASTHLAAFNQWCKIEVIQELDMAELADLVITTMPNLA